MRHFEIPARRAKAGLLAALLLCAAVRSAPLEATELRTDVGPAAAALSHSQVIGSRPDPNTAIPPSLILANTKSQCVPYARRRSGIGIRGNAWTWWRSAAGHYSRRRTPAVGAVLVLSRSRRLVNGHLAVVTRKLGRREILVDHANWLNRGKIRENVPVRDVSANNDWSAVKVWYTPGNKIGRRTYPAYGFIHPRAIRLLRLRQPRLRGADVRALQATLRERGFDLAVDGIFGVRTRDALIAYQGRSGLVEDGIVGVRTRAGLGL